jgi:hypothetical protein
MKSISISLLILITSIAVAQESNPLIITGELYSNHRLLLKDQNDWAWNENRLDLAIQKRSGSINFYSNIWLRHLNAPQPQAMAQLYGKEQINPLHLELREAYAEVRGFVFDNLDMKIGRQLITWGTADQFNPTNNLNPFDLEDVLDFGRRRGIEAVNLNWYINHSLSLQAVYIPFFRPANLPVGIFSDILTNNFELPGGLAPNEYADNLIMPGNNFRQGATAGIRLKAFAANTDFSLSYIYGRDGLPQPTSAHLHFSPEGFLLHTELLFPRHHILGADLAGSLGSVGVWVEAALFIPEKEIILNISHNLPPGVFIIPPSFDSIVLKKNPYLKYVAGADYTFRNGIYVNLQYMHGFIHERGKGNQNDYLVLAFERSFFGDRLLVRPLAGGMAISEWDKPVSNYALFYTPEITWKGIDNLELGLGAFFFDGKGDNIFADLRDYNMVAVKAKVSF